MKQFVWFVVTPLILLTILGYCFGNKIQEHSSTIQVISTAAILLVTAWYAYTTFRILETARFETSIKLRPYLALNSWIDKRLYSNKVSGVPPIQLVQDTGPPYPGFDIQLKFHITNVGRVPCCFSVIRLIANNIDVKPSNVDYVLFPTQQIEYMSVRSGQLSQALEYEGEIVLEFWTEGNSERYRLNRKFKKTPSESLILNEEFVRV